MLHNNEQKSEEIALVEDESVSPTQEDLFNPGFRKRQAHENERKSFKTGLRTNIEKFIYMLDPDTPIVDEARARMEFIQGQLPGELTEIKREMLRRFVFLGLILDHVENMILNGEEGYDPDKLNNYYFAAVGKHQKLGEKLGVEVAERDPGQRDARTILKEIKGKAV